MSWSKFIWIPLGVTMLAFFLIVGDQLVATAIGPPGAKAFAWICFTSWPLYYLAGGDQRAAGKVLLSFGVGMVASVAIMNLAGMVGQHLGGLWAAPVAIAVVAFVVLCLERFPPFDFVPGIFVSMAVFFAITLYVDGSSHSNTALVESAYGVVGVALGWLSGALRGAYTGWVERSAVKRNF